MPRHHLHGRLERAQDDLLTAIVRGPDALIAFQNQWSKLVADFDKEIHQLDDGILEMANSTASIISTLTGSFLELETKATDLYSKLSKGLEDALDNDEPLISLSSPPISPLLSHPYRDLHVWLQQNIHNPYPSATAKAILAASSGLSSESVALWFRNAREQIGWTTLARHRFKGSRSAIVDAARCAFLRSDDNRSLPSTLRHAFSVIKQNLDNLSPDADKCVIAREPEESEDTTTVAIESGMQTPQRSFALDNPRPLQLLRGDDSEEDEEDMTPPPPIAGCKRRADSYLEACDSSRSPKEIRYRSPKRQRSEPPSTSNQVHSSPVLTLTETEVQASNVESALPSPIRLTPSFTSDSFIPASPALPSFPTTHSPSQPLASTPSSRKRRLSDAGCDINHKRPRHIHNDHRMQIVSNPFPLGPNEIAQDSALFESWYQNVTYAASEPFGGDLSSDCSPATSILNTPWTDGLPVLPNDFMVPSQQVDLSDEDFKAMLASGYNISSMFMPIDQGIFETLPSLDDLFPPSLPGLETPRIEQPAQYMIDLGVQAVSTSQIEACQAQSSSIPASLSYDHPRQILSSPLEEIDRPISDTLTQCTSLCDIGEDTLDNWTAGLPGWMDTCPFTFNHTYQRKSTNGLK